MLLRKGKKREPPLLQFAAYASRSPEWEGRPGNYRLMVKQGYGEQQALELAEAEGMHWLMHIDPDELVTPGGPVFSITGKDESDVPGRCSPVWLCKYTAAAARPLA